MKKLEDKIEDYLPYIPDPPEEGLRYCGTLVSSKGVIGCLIKTPENKEFWDASEENPIR